MPDQPEAPATPWPDWLADLTPEDRVRAIADAVAECYGDHQCQGKADHFRESAGGQHCTVGVAGDLLLRLLGEARQQAPVPSADAHAYLSTSCLHASEPGREHLHGYCQSATGFVAGVATWPKTPAVCKFCQSPCRCGCHSGEPVAAAAEPVSFAAALELRSQIADALGGFLDLEQATIAADSVMAVVVPALRAQSAPAPSAEYSQAIAALTRLSLEDPMTDWVPGNHAYLALDAEMTARREHAAGTLETIAKLGEIPEPGQPGPLTHFTTAGQSQLAADNFPACKAQHWAIVSPYVRQVTCDDCLTWLGSAVGNLTRALANAAAVIDRRDAELGEPDPEPPLPPGKWGRAELPGRREHTGFIADETRFGQQAAVIRDWNGAEIACVYGGPGCQIVWLPTPLKRPEPQKAITGTGDTFGFAGLVDDDDDDPWASDEDD